MAEDGSNTSPSQQPPLHIHRPIPRRTFDTSAYQDSADSPTHAFSQATPPSANENRRSSDFLAQLNARLLRTFRDEESEEQEGPPPRNKSFLNMTSSTLSGIYDEIGSATAGERSTMETPWGTGAETPAHTSMGMPAWETGHGSPDGGISMKNQLRRRSSNYKPQGKNKSHPSKAARQGPLKYAVIASKLAALYVFGIIYGLIVSQLHETRHLAPMRMEGVNRNNGVYLASWGAFGVALGSLLPYVDLIWDGQRSKDDTEEDDRPESSPISEQINDIVRSVCAFIGIAFAIRRLPWQSTLQLTLTLALVNPALWYILDRSRPGLSLSLIVTSVATSFIFLHNPDALPSPPLPATTNVTRLHSSGRDRIHAGNPSSASSQNPELFAGMVSYENLAVVTWVGSVLFCSCVCFGSIGRRLGVLDGSSSASKR